MGFQDLKFNITFHELYTLWYTTSPTSHQKNIVGGGFKHFLFSPSFGEDSHFDEHIFQRGWFNHQLDNPYQTSTDFHGVHVAQGMLGLVPETWPPGPVVLGDVVRLFWVMLRAVQVGSPRNKKQVNLQ